MSPKKSILKTLSVQHKESGPGNLTRPATIPGWQTKPDKYQEAINTLLQERLIEGTKDPEGRLAISLNTHRMAEIRKELRPFWFHPAFMALMALLAAAAGMGFMG